MNLTINIEPHTLNKSPSFLRLIERIRQCLREREITKEQQRHRKNYSILHYIEHLKRCIDDNPLIDRALFRFYRTIKKFSSQDKQFPSTILFDNHESKTSLEEKVSFDNLFSINNEIDPKADSSKISLTMAQSTKSTTHFIQPFGIPRQTSGLMTKTTLTAINKTPRQRTSSDTELLEHLLNRCENLRHLPADVRRYAARSLLLLTYHPNTILTRQNCPPFLIYIIVYGQCKLLLETSQTTIFGQQLNIGDVYGDDSLQLIIDHRLNGLITNENNSCHLTGFFSRDIRAYENYLSDMMKQSLLEQLRMQSTFSAMQWRNDIFDYFLKWSRYKQYSVDEIIYGNEEEEHENLYFIVTGQVSFVCLLEFPSMLIKHPEFYRNITKAKMIPIKTTENINPQTIPHQNKTTTWRFLEIFLLSTGDYFGFESTTHHSWYLTRSTVDIISIPKNRFKELGYFAPMIFDKLRQDFLDIYPTELFIRYSYLKHLQINQSNENHISTIQFKRSIINNNHSQKINWIPEQTTLSTKQKNLLKNKKK